MTLKLILQKKEKQWQFGYKTYIAVDKETGLLHNNKIISDNVHDVTVLEQLLLEVRRNLWSFWLFRSKKSEKNLSHTTIKNENQVQNQQKYHLRAKIAQYQKDK